MSSIIMTSIRIILSVILIYLSYRETGTWTAVVIFLVMINSEFAAIISKSHLKRINKLEENES